jgi:hypothetical protein
LPCCVPDAHALALDDDPGIGAFEGLVLDQVVPEMRAVGLDDGAEIVGLIWLFILVLLHRMADRPAVWMTQNAARQ